MGTMFDYLEWRGDIEFSQIPMNPVDALIFSTLSYIWFDDVVADVPNIRIRLKDAANMFFKINGYEEMMRVKQDAVLLASAANTLRFGETEVSFFRNVFDEEKETQFAAMTFYLDDDTAVLVFRGTDQTLAGWKEDFNMSFCETIPSQREALRYLEDFASSYENSFYLAGHSKGGNVAVYAASKTSKDIQERIIQIYNNDGPGFTEHLMGFKGYLDIVPIISTFIPQSSVIGMLLQHEEAYTVIKSRQYGIMQHDPYSWEVMGPDFVRMEEVSEGSKRLDRALKNWLSEMEPEERSNLVDVVYDFLTEDGASNTMDLVKLKYIAKYINKLRKNEDQRLFLTNELKTLLRKIKEAHNEPKEIQ